MNLCHSRLPLASALVASLLAITAPLAEAQTCFGAASFSDGFVRTAATAGFSDDVNGLTALVAAGRPSGLWGSASISRLSFDGVSGGDEIAPAYGATLAYAFDVGPAANQSSVQLCPYVGYQQLEGLDVGLGGGLGFMKIRSRSFLTGASVGTVVPSSPRLSFVPAAGLSYVRERVKVHMPGFWPEATTEDYGVLDVAFGLVFNRRITTQLGAAVPFGVDDASSSFSLSVGLSFGR